MARSVFHPAPAPHPSPPAPSCTPRWSVPRGEVQHAFPRVQVVAQHKLNILVLARELLLVRGVQHNLPRLRQRHVRLNV